MIFRSKAPLRIGLAGGGTDVSPYSDEYGGAILNATINYFAYCSIKLLDGDKVILNSYDQKQRVELDTSSTPLKMDGTLDLLKGVYNRIVKDFIKRPVSLELTTFVDAPPGSGLGSSSTLVVAIIGSFVECFKLPLGEYDIAHLAYEIERVDLKMAGGKQDQYAATFGGFNYMEFYKDNKVIVNPLRVKPQYINELEHNLILYYTGTSRLSSKIIESQMANVKSKSLKSIESMDKLKEQAVLMKEAILKGNIDEIGGILNYGWKHKKNMAEDISNSVIDDIYDAALKAGATGGKLSGAGGGGFMIFYCKENMKYEVESVLGEIGGVVKRFQFVPDGLSTWASN
ncbi:dehydrogenase [Candidatus Marinamargulisbacteria bacterium SCGC AAA071-K20]|nr:dehydrogenase [Candidatus Marinamargulisbacteria bacterium SCGC AAA071-K20]